MGLIFGSRKKVVIEVFHRKGHEKRNLMVLVSVAQHLRVRSYEHFKLKIHCTIEWGIKLKTKMFSAPKLKEL